MVKLIALLKKKPGFSTEALIEYYEKHHAPLAARITAMGHDYRRNYVRAVRVSGTDGAPDYDVISEVWFRDQLALEAFAASVADPAIRAQIVADEERFLDRSASRIYVVEEHASPHTGPEKAAIPHA